MTRKFLIYLGVLLNVLGGAKAVAPSAATSGKKPNVVYFLVDNLGMGELSSYSGGPFRAVTTSRIDAFAKEGMMLLNFAPEAQCTPSRSALMTGRYSINLDTDPKEREPVDYPYLHTWVGAHVAKILSDHEASVKREPLIPLGAPLDFVPKRLNDKKGK